MSLQIGEIDLAQSAINTEYGIRALELIIDKIMGLNPQLNRPSISDIEAIRHQAISDLGAKYPNSGIKLVQ